MKTMKTMKTYNYDRRTTDRRSKVASDLVKIYRDNRLVRSLGYGTRSTPKQDFKQALTALDNLESSLKFLRADIRAGKELNERDLQDIMEDLSGAIEFAARGLATIELNGSE